MNRLQFLSLLSPAVGSSVLVILAWMSSSQRLNRLEQVVDSLSRDLREFQAGRACRRDRPSLV